MTTNEISDSNIFEKKKISEEDVLRCPECYLIPFISINHSQRQSMLQFKCFNNHEINKPLKELYFESKKYQINSIKCLNCNEKDISKLFYCIKCFGFYCERENHSLKEEHDILIPVSKLDSCCFEKNHQINNVTAYCKTHNKNICHYCTQDKHRKDNIIIIEFLKENEIETIKSNIQKFEENFNELSNRVNSIFSSLKRIIEEIKNEFNLFKENNELEIKLLKDLINIYELKKNCCDLNFQIIQNVKNISFNGNINFEYNLNNVNEIINNLFSQFNSYLIEIKNSNISQKYSKNKKKKYMLENINSIESHNNWVTSVSVFPLGNIVSVSKDQSIIIYDINFKISQKIENAHYDGISYVDIKDDNNFITCSFDKSIKLWKKNKNQFINYKTLSNAHNDAISKVIYCSNGNFISCSWDNTIKIWKENNDNYENIITLEHQKKVCSILLLEDKNILISSGLDKTMLWELHLNELNYCSIYFIKTITDTCCQWNGGICRVGKDKIIYQDKSKSLKVISIIKGELIKEIQFKFGCFGIYSVNNKRIFLTGGKSKDIKVYSNDTYECIQTIQNAHDDNIFGFVELKYNLIASFSYDKKINIWCIKDI